MIKYHKCPGCSTIFTDDDITSAVVTENEAPEKRNNTELFNLRLARVKATTGSFFDFGCGNGEFVEHLRTLPGVKAIGLDVDTRLKLKDLVAGSFDGAFMVEVIEHLVNPVETVYEILSKLKPGGFLYIETTFADSIPDHTNHPYVNPGIGHRTILSAKAITALSCYKEWINLNAVVLRT